MRMNKQGKGGSNAVDEEKKRQVRAMAAGAPLARLALDEYARIRQKAQSANANVKTKAPTALFSPLHHNKRNNRQRDQGEHRG